jgi:hypothetical protein
MFTRGTQGTDSYLMPLGKMLSDPDSFCKKADKMPYQDCQRPAPEADIETARGNNIRDAFNIYTYPSHAYVYRKPPAEETHPSPILAPQLLHSSPGLF